MPITHPILELKKLGILDMSLEELKAKNKTDKELRKKLRRERKKETVNES